MTDKQLMNTGLLSLTVMKEKLRKQSVEIDAQQELNKPEQKNSFLFIKKKEGCIANG